MPLVYELYILFYGGSATSGVIVLIPILLFHVLPAGGTGVGHELKLLCRTFHAGG